MTIKHPLYLVNENLFVRKHKEYFIVEKTLKNRRKKKISVPTENISYIVKFGNIDLDYSIFSYCSDNKIIIYFFTKYGKYFGCFMPVAGQSKIKEYQYRFNSKEKLPFGKIEEIIKPTTWKESVTQFSSHLFEVKIHSLLYQFELEPSYGFMNKDLAFDFLSLIEKEIKSFVAHVNVAQYKLFFIVKEDMVFLSEEGKMYIEKKFTEWLINNTDFEINLKNKIIKFTNIIRNDD